MVHAKHGIGKYVGLTRLSVDNQEREYLALVYQNEDKLYVPADQVNLLHHYRGGTDGPAPKLHKMGGVEWNNTKSRVKKGLKELAEDLVKLYAARAHLEGYAYPPDTLWQREMEEAFPFTETIDQMKAIEETKRDMERTRPMDRLVCGDVGFGKTEVAIRAAFKAIMAGKQVAVLAPTTVLAQQHYQVFRERFAPYPIRVGQLSRFRTAKEQREVVAKLKTGEIDLVIGTHRVLSKDLGFKDLGLVVIDEEHRFGVANKERLKQVKRLVDVLTMSATPIPRTLYMSLSGARDMSLIATPPMNRQPVRTHVGPYDPDTVRTAILHEMERGGQIFFLHNRVESIHRVGAELNALVPEARIRVAHGQMGEDDLEDIMIAFKDHEFDILVSTTIIESGLDIPRANTMVIDDGPSSAWRELYQLRGRVGRSETKAYCYCFYTPGKQLSDESRDRLAALQQFTALGSGYQIALRDLEIRGVGNLLGPEQHGQMMSVGFDLYTKPLAAAIKRVRADDRDPVEVPVTVAVKLDAIDLGDAADRRPARGRLPLRRCTSPRRRWIPGRYRGKAASDTLPAVGEIEHELHRPLRPAAHRGAPPWSCSGLRRAGPPCRRAERRPRGRGRNNSVRAPSSPRPLSRRRGAAGRSAHRPPPGRAARQRRHRDVVDARPVAGADRCGHRGDVGGGVSHRRLLPRGVCPIVATHSLLQDAQAISPRRSAARDAADHPTAGRDTDGAANSDESLDRRAQSGDRDAIVAVYRRYVNEIFGYAYHQLGNAQDAEDVTSETFLRLVGALDGLDHRASFRTWLYTVARNQLRDRWRQRGRQPAITDWDGADNADRSVAADAARRSDAAAPSEGDHAPGHSPWAELGRQVMAALPESYRTVLAAPRRRRSFHPRRGRGDGDDTRQRQGAPVPRPQARRRRGGRPRASWRAAVRAPARR